MRIHCSLLIKIQLAGDFVLISVTKCIAIGGLRGIFAIRLVCSLIIPTQMMCVLRISYEYTYRDPKLFHVLPRKNEWWKKEIYLSRIFSQVNKVSDCKCVPSSLSRSFIQKSITIHNRFQRDWLHFYFFFHITYGSRVGSCRFTMFNEGILRGITFRGNGPCVSTVKRSWGIERGENLTPALMVRKKKCGFEIEIQNWKTCFENEHVRKRCSHTFDGCLRHNVISGYDTAFHEISDGFSSFTWAFLTGVFGSASFTERGASLGGQRTNFGLTEEVLLLIAGYRLSGVMWCIGCFYTVTWIFAI